MDIAEPWFFPPVITALLLTAGMSLLLGLGLREYYLVNQKRIVFGTTRTCMLIGLLGFVLYHLQPGGALYLCGLLILGLWLGLFYWHKLAREQMGLIGLLLALISYTVGPVSLTLPTWFLLLYVISALFILNAKEDIHLLTLKMVNEEIITLAKFLVLSGVILPLTSREPLAPFLPVSIHQTWMAVVVISGISYLSYLIQRYFLQGRGILLTGAFGGLYSSTAATIVLARQSRRFPATSTRPAVAIVLATAMMYLRLLAIVLLFNAALGMKLLPGFLGLSLLAGMMALLLRRRNHEPADISMEAETPQNPLELSTALFFAFSFLAVTAITHFILQHYPQQGLQWMALFTGFTDIDPFILALVGGRLPAALPDMGQAILIATASNNLLKAGYVAILAAGATRWQAGLALLTLAIVTLGTGYLLLP
ncbi:MAG: DUF4010 domain-containing protein [Methylococcus sp.]|nr:MAG: DUF4010 domain-containing protein [Methylococcus sp.]